LYLVYLLSMKPNRSNLFWRNVAIQRPSFRVDVPWNYAVCRC